MAAAAAKTKPVSSPGSMRIVVETNPSDSKLSEMNIKFWPKWGCPAGKYQLKFDAKETCYLLKGKVKAYPKGSPDFVEFGAGDLVTIPKGFSCSWDVSVAVDKYYKWGCPAGKYQLKFDAKETCYLLKGKVKAYPKGSPDFVEFGAGDLVTIPKGFSCSWDVSVAVDKYYKFESSTSPSPFFEPI